VSALVVNDCWLSWRHGSSRMPASAQAKQLKSTNGTSLVEVQQIYLLYGWEASQIVKILKERGATGAFHCWTAQARQGTFEYERRSRVFIFKFEIMFFPLGMPSMHSLHPHY